LEEYISRIRKLGADDFVNGETFNSVIEQIQHNVDLLYRSQASSVENWNISELIYGNMLDYDETGQKRFVNGGKIDSLEKVLPFSVSLGDVFLEENVILNNNEWLRWSMPSGVKDNLKLSRDIAVPEALRHQNILVGFKFMPFVGNDVVTNERYEIYINGVYAGTGETDIVELNGVSEAKTIYGVYNLTGEETSLEISLVRSVTNGETPVEYVVRVSNIFVGLHTLGNSSFTMNYPISGSSFIGTAADINSFFDFENNAVRPIPSFLINSEQLEGGGSLTVNIETQENEFQHEYWVGYDGSGNELGVTSENVMAMEDFMLIDAFSANVITINLQSANDTYTDLVFDKGNYEIHIDDAFAELFFENVTISNNSALTIFVEPNASSTILNLENITITDSSHMNISVKDGLTDPKLKIMNSGSIEVSENSYLRADAGTFSQTILGAASQIYIHDGGKVFLTLNEDTLANIDGQYGFGMSLGSIHLDKYSHLELKNTGNTAMQLHLGVGVDDDAVTINNHSHLVTEGFDAITTSAVSKKFKGKLHSSIEIFDEIQSDGGATAFTDIDMELFSSFGSTIPIGTLNESLVESFIYEIET
jgi:hypothetical protein